MSDADDQMGGTGGETGPPPGGGDNPAKKASPGSGQDEDRVTKESEESFPASDPPANY